MSTVPLVPPINPLADQTEADQQRDTDPASSEVAPRSSDWATLQDALTRTVDAREGFEKMAELAETEFSSTVGRFLDLHRRHGEVLTRILADANQLQDADGSMMGSVNRMVVTARAAVDEIDADTLSQIHSGEESVRSAYEKVLLTRLPSDLRSKMSELLDELNELLATTSPSR